MENSNKNKKAEPSKQTPLNKAEEPLNLGNKTPCVKKNLWLLSLIGSISSIAIVIALLTLKYNYQLQKRLMSDNRHFTAQIKER